MHDYVSMHGLFGGPARVRGRDEEASSPSSNNTYLKRPVATSSHLGVQDTAK